MLDQADDVHIEVLNEAALKRMVLQLERKIKTNQSARPRVPLDDSAPCASSFVSSVIAECLVDLLEDSACGARWEKLSPSRLGGLPVRRAPRRVVAKRCKPGDSRRCNV